MCFLIPPQSPLSCSMSLGDSAIYLYMQQNCGKYNIIIILDLFIESFTIHPIHPHWENAYLWNIIDKSDQLWFCGLDKYGLLLLLCRSCVVWMWYRYVNRVNISKMAHSGNTKRKFESWKYFNSCDLDKYRVTIDKANSSHKWQIFPYLSFCN